MAIVNVENIGQYGINKDLSSSELPINAWTDCKNIRFLDGYANQFSGHAEVYATPSFTPQHVLPCAINSVRYWVYTTATKTFCVTNTAGVTVHTDITHVTPRAGVTNQWTSTLLSGIPVINAGDTATVPMYWSLNTANKFIDLANWPTNNFCKSIRAYKNYLIALNVTRPNAIVISSITRVATVATLTTAVAHGLSNGNTIQITNAVPAQYNGTYVIAGVTSTTFTYTMASDPGASASPVGNLYGGALSNYPYMVKWSQPADPGTVPSSWDQNDPTKDAGEFDLAEGPDIIIDGLQLRDSFMIYKESSIWRMDFTGGTYVFRFQKVLGTSGALNRNCIVEVDGQHVVLTGSDVIIHDGQTATSILDKQTRRSLFQTVDSSNANLCFVFKNTFFNEVFICYPSVGMTSCDKAMVWNYKDKTVSFRDLPSLNHASQGSIDTGLSGTWNSDAESWDSDITLWETPDTVPAAARVLMASGDGKLYNLDSSSTFNGTNVTSYLERIGLTFGASEGIKLITGIRPRIRGTTGGTVLIKVGFSNDPYASPTYTTTMTHTIGTTVRNDCFAAGRYISIRFESGTAYQWRLDSYSFEVENGGMW